jgi:hypothetical protein
VVPIVVAILVGLLGALCVMWFRLQTSKAEVENSKQREKEMRTASYNLRLEADAEKDRLKKEAQVRLEQQEKASKEEIERIRRDNETRMEELRCNIMEKQAQEESLKLRIQQLALQAFAAEDIAALTRELDTVSRDRDTMSLEVAGLRNRVVRAASNRKAYYSERPAQSNLSGGPIFDSEVGGTTPGMVHSDDSLSHQRNDISPVAPLQPGYGGRALPIKTATSLSPPVASTTPIVSQLSSSPGAHVADTTAASVSLCFSCKTAACSDDKHCYFCGTVCRKLKT